MLLRVYTKTNELINEVIFDLNIGIFSFRFVT